MEYNKRKIIALEKWEQQFFDEITPIKDAIEEVLNVKAEYEVKIEVWHKMGILYPDKSELSKSNIDNLKVSLENIEQKVKDYETAYNNIHDKYAPYIGAIKSVMDNLK